MIFNHYSKHQSIKNVNETRVDYYAQRLLQAEERIFSHVDKYAKAKLQNDSKTHTIIYNCHSILGATDKKWVLGLLSQKEDSNYYIEDSTYVIRISFAELEYVEPDAFFTE